jgi:hypothetical protein
VREPSLYFLELLQYGGIEYEVISTQGRADALGQKTGFEVGAGPLAGEQQGQHLGWHRKQAAEGGLAGLGGGELHEAHRGKRRVGLEVGLIGEAARQVVAGQQKKRRFAGGQKACVGFAPHPAKLSKPRSYGILRENSASST